MHPEIFDNYVQSPEIEFYENHKNGYEDTHYVKNSVEVWPTPISIDWLYQAYNDGQITSLSPYLQRVLLTKVWKAKKLLANGRPGTVLEENLTVACQSDSIQILEIQREGKNKQLTQDFLLGKKISKDSLLT